MMTSEAGIALIQEFEGRRLTAYVCPAGVLTIGYGHTSVAGPPTVEEGMHISKQKALDILRSDLHKFESGVSSIVKVDLNQSQFDVLVSFAFNCGLGALRKSTLLKRVNAGNFDAVPAELMKWTKGGGKALPGLVRRRRAEAGMWRGLAGDTDPDEGRMSPDAPVSSKKIIHSKEAGAAAVAGSAGLAAAAQEVIPAIQQASSVIGGLSDAIGRPAVIAFIVVAIAAAGILYWRKQRLDEEAA
jgi:lysozyme